MGDRTGKQAIERDVRQAGRRTSHALTQGHGDTDGPTGCMLRDRGPVCFHSMSTKRSLFVKSFHG